MERAAVTSRFMSTVLVVSLLSLVVLGPKSSRAGEGDPKMPPADAKVSPKSCFTLLNADKLPPDALPAARLKAAQVEVHIGDQTLKEIIKDFGRVVGVPMVVAPTPAASRALDRKGSWFDGKVSGISARGYLDYMLESISDFEESFSWDVCEGTIVVRAYSEGCRDSMESRVYSLDSLLGEQEFGGRGGCCDPMSDDFQELCEDDIIELITSKVAPEDWQEVGGPGTLCPFARPGSRVLVIRNSRAVHGQITALFAIVEKMFDGKLGGHRLLRGGTISQYSEIMDRKVTLNLENVTLAELASAVGKQINMPVLLDRRGILEERIDLDTYKLSCRCKNRPLRTVLKGLSQYDALMWAWHYDALLLTSKEREYMRPETSLVDVTDLIKGPNKFGSYSRYSRSDELIELVTTTVDPDGWQCGRQNMIDTYQKQGRILLAVQLPMKILEQMERLFTGLRAVRDKKLQCFPQTSKADREVLDKLAKRTKWDVEEGTTLASFLDELQRRHGVTVRVDERELENIGVDDDDLKVGPIHVDDFSAGNMLSLLLEPSEIDWVVRQGEVFVSTEEYLDMSLSTVIYEVSDLTVQVDAQGNVSHDEDSLKELICSTVAPETWGGCGPPPISSFSYGRRNMVFPIRQTYKVHREIAQLLADLRAAMPKDPAKRVLPVCYPFTMEGTGYRDGYGEPVGYFYHEEKNDTKENRSNRERPKKRERKIRRWFLGRR